MSSRIESFTRRSWIVFAALVFLALLIRLAWLDRKSLWMDEAYTLVRSGQTIADIIGLPGDATPPLFYLGMHYWIALGHSEFLLRLPSAVLGALTVGLTFWLGRYWFDRWTATGAALLLALAPIHVWSSQEARMYAIASCFGVASVLSLTCAAKNGRWQAWFCWIIATLLSLYTHYTTAFLVVVELVLLVPACRLVGAPARRIVTGYLSFAVIVALFLPWAIGMVGVFAHFQAMVSWYFEPVSRVLALFGISLSAVQVVSISAPVGLAAMAVASWAGWQAVRWWQTNGFPHRSRLAILVVVLYVLVLVFSAWPSGYGIRRQAAIFMPYGMLGVAYSLSVLQRRRVLLAVLAVAVLPVLLINLALTEWQDWRSTAGFLQRNATPQDLILVSSAYYDEPFGYYFHDAVDWSGANPSEIPGRLTRAAEGKSRVWLVLCAEIHEDPDAKLPAWLRAQRGAPSHYQFPGIRVQVYGPVLGPAVQ